MAGDYKTVKEMNLSYFPSPIHSFVHVLIIDKMEASVKEELGQFLNKKVPAESIRYVTCKLSGTCFLVNKLHNL